MSLPKDILAPNVPIGTLDANGNVLMNSNWWLLFYNIVQNVLGNTGSLPASALIELASLESDASDADAITLRQPISSLAVQSSMIDDVQIPAAVSAEALMALLSDDVQSLTYSNQILLALGATFIDQVTPSTPSSGRIDLYSRNSGSSGISQLNTLDPTGANLVVGFENHMVVYNGSGSDIAVGQLVYIAGSHATTPSIALAKADSATTLPAVGFTQYAIPNGTYGQIHVSGSVAATTTGFADGDTIYVSATSAGAFTKTAPSTAGQYVQQVGVVTNGGVGAGAGRLQLLFLTETPAVLPVASGGTGVTALSSLTANPSASVGLSTVNGAASTFMRSDAAPALDQTIAPTWTAKHTFSLSGSLAAPTISLASAQPVFELDETDQTTDEKKWSLVPVSKVLQWRSVNDAGSSSITWMSVTRGTGTAISSIAIGDATNNSTFTFSGTGTVTFNGSITCGAVSGGAITGNRFIPNSSTVPSNGMYLPGVNTCGIATNTTLAVSWDASQNLLNVGSVKSSSATGGVGYATGAGGAVTQGTNRTTAVTLNKTCGQITLVSAAGTTAWQTFTVNNTSVAATDGVVAWQVSGTDKNLIHVTNVQANRFDITFSTTGGTTTEQPVFGFAVVKAVTA